MDKSTNEALVTHGLSLTSTEYPVSTKQNLVLAIGHVIKTRATDRHFINNICKCIFFKRFLMHLLIITIN